MARRTCLAAAALLCLMMAPAVARSQEVTASHRALIEQLMELTGAQNVGNQMGVVIVQQMYNALRNANPNLPNEAIEILEGVTMDLLIERSGELLAQFVPLYAKYFSEAEIRELVEFYETPLGRKAIRVVPSIVQESVPLSQAWAESLRPEMEQRIRAKLGEAGYL